MAAVFASEEQVAQVIDKYRTMLGVAAVNGPRQVVLSGDMSSISGVLSELGPNVSSRRLHGSTPFHSALMGGVARGFESSLDEMGFGEVKSGLKASSTRPKQTQMQHVHYLPPSARRCAEVPGGHFQGVRGGFDDQSYE